MVKVISPFLHLKHQSSLTFLLKVQVYSWVCFEGLLCVYLKLLLQIIFIKNLRGSGLHIAIWEAGCLWLFCFPAELEESEAIGHTAIPQQQQQKGCE